MKATWVCRRDFVATGANVFHTGREISKFLKVEK